tara:strand:- start:936 stop:1172 length:237 start_codon:yes stop_codon:yes gene_type:complete
MKKVNSYIIWVGVGLLALGIFVNFIMVRSSNDKRVNDSLKKARAEKERKRKERLKDEEEANKEAEEIINSLTVIENKN